MTRKSAEQTGVKSSKLRTLLVIIAVAVLCGGVAGISYWAGTRSQSQADTDAGATTTMPTLVLHASAAEAEALGITDVLSTHTETWEGTRSRQQYVQTTAEHALDVLVSPGAEYDFNAIVGPRTAERGFPHLACDPWVQYGPEVDLEDSWASQVSTALFVAAFEAGLDITERHNSPWMIKHYPMGLDAWVGEEPPCNLRFVNNTGNYIWVHGVSDGITTTVTIMGTDDGREVSWETGDFYEVEPLTESTVMRSDLGWPSPFEAYGGQSGGSLMVKRTVTWPNGEAKETAFISTWEMEPRVILIDADATTTTTP